MKNEMELEHNEGRPSRGTLIAVTWTAFAVIFVVAAVLWWSFG
jgi:hypothetical protein